MSESAPESLPVAESASPVLTSGLPFAFAQSRNVLLERSGAALTLHYVPPLATDVLLEVRRHVGEVFSLAPLDEDQFRQRLTVATVSRWRNWSSSSGANENTSPT